MTPALIGGGLGWLLWLAGLMSGLRSARQRAARAERAARACHELRGAITAARLGLGLAGRAGELSPAALRAIELELSRAALSVHDLGAALAGGAGGGQWECQPVDIPILLADCVEASRADAVRGTACPQVEWSGPVRCVWGDRVRLAQAVRNLLANAIEHGGGEIFVRGRGDAQTVRIEVSDAGRGLPAPVAELVRRRRAGRGARGRGLAIAASVAEHHGGRLAAAPSDRGARLVLELPSVLEESGTAPAPEAGSTRT